MPAASERLARAEAGVTPAAGRRWEGPILGAAIVLSATFYVAPWPWLYLPALAALAAIGWMQLDITLALVPAFLPFFMEPKRFTTHFELAPSEVFILLNCAIAAGLLASRQKRTAVDWQQVRRSRFILPAGLLLLAALLSTALAADRHVALRSLREVVLEPVAYGLLLLLWVRDRGWWLQFAGLVAGGVVSGVIGISQYLTHTNLTLVQGTSVQRVRALYGSPDNLGLLYDRVVPVCLAVLALARLRAYQRASVLISTGIVVVALALSNSRGAWAAVALATVFMLALSMRWGRWIGLVVVVVAIAGAAVRGPQLVHAFRSSQTNTLARRLDIWRSSVRMVRDHPVYGVGPDNYLHYYAPTRREDRWQRECAPGIGYMMPGAGAEPCLSHPHNELLDFWLSTGLLGLAAFLWLQWTFWTSAVQLWLRSSAAIPSLLLGSMGAMFAADLHGLIDNSYFLMDLSVIFWLLCAFLSWSWVTPEART